jgi:hypothetical protein
MSSREALKSPPKKEAFKILIERVEEIIVKLNTRFDYVYSIISYTTDNNATKFPRPIVYTVKITVGMDDDDFRTKYDFDVSDTNASRIITELIKWTNFIMEG